MTERIKNHLDTLLQGAPNTRRVDEMRQELLAGCLDKYADLTAEGVAPEEAYQQVIGGIGDVRELLGHIEKANAFDPVELEQKRKKRALFTCTGIACFIVGLVLAIIADSFAGLDEIGGIIMLIFIGAGVLILIYGRMTNSVKYEKVDDTIVEDIKVQMAKGRGGKRENKLMGLASSSLWCVIILVYFIINFFFQAWEISWIIFPFGAALQCCLSAYFFPATKWKSLTGAYWCMIVVIYLLLSFITGNWGMSWMLFILGAAGQLSVRFYMAWRDEQ